MKGQKNEMLTRQESRKASRPEVFYFFSTAHFLKQLPTHFAHDLSRFIGIAKAPQANTEIKALSKNAILPGHQKSLVNIIFELNKTVSIIPIC